jgi:hypothetical protein
MTITHRNKAANGGRSYASVASTVPNLSIRVPEPVHTTNAYSVLDSNKNSDNDSSTTGSSEVEFTWKDTVSNSDDDMPPLVDPEYTSNETSDELSDEDARVSEQEEDFVSVKSSDEEESDDDIIVNHKQYRRVRTNKRCKDGVPPAITWAFFFFALAQFMQLVFLICKNVPHRHCISDPF